MSQESDLMATPDTWHVLRSPYIIMLVMPR